MNHRAWFDAAVFILTGEIRNCTNKKNKTKLQTVNDIYTACLSACVDNKYTVVLCDNEITASFYVQRVFVVGDVWTDL